MKTNQIFGNGAITNIYELIDKYDAEKIFLVTGKKSYDDSKKLCEFKSVLKKYNILRYSEFSLNPKIEDAWEGIKKIRKFCPDIIISIGGGSVIDMAKIINILSHQKLDIDLDLISNNKIRNKGLPHIAIPTTSGTGSESTHFAVLYIGKKKYSLAHEYILPVASLIDPELTFDSPSYLIASAGMDALSQAIESYWSNNSSKKSDYYAENAINLILDNLTSAVNLKNKNSMTSMAKAASLSGKAINISKTTAAHAISYGITSEFGISHGHAVALTLGEFFVINSDRKSKFINKNISFSKHQEKMLKLFSLFDAKSSNECRYKWYELMKSINLEYSFSKLNMTNKRKIASIINNVNTERLENNPISVSKEIVKQIFSDDRNNLEFHRISS